MMIRTEAPADLVRLDGWWRETLMRPMQADQLQQLRETGQISLSLLATDDMGEILGHIAITDAQTANNTQEITLWHSPDANLVMPLLDEAESTLFELGYSLLKIAPSDVAEKAEFAPLNPDDTWWYKQLAAATST
ncbi:MULTISPECIES: GNAT family N-acetyltransferase [unclassified Salinivibrio]|uniref:GNAT family N-acetyltransferase n=1 Tax=unclassified Salinivibrio TaxID=2636825 RepID=UPI00128B3DA3|nr:MULTISPECIES: hypothetical protein [unclassified Salinivibrio]MPX91231.1 hypothetical protein [Salinivibrio sp. VYel1]MPX94937.1 hypothetical protein [Salinivibrio sp. VYel9]MPX97849.1 hypothetical protein [Salinivibrio sp. VYel6]MPY01167.1 hypothetical protein [Salinivibrio sp. VYel4]MPY04243.1 hypothetical protein [Salinivibrio sp. VYel5]